MKIITTCFVFLCCSCIYAQTPVTTPVSAPLKKEKSVEMKPSTLDPYRKIKRTNHKPKKQVIAAKTKKKKHHKK